MGVIDDFLKTVSQIPANAVKDVGNIASGVMQLPQAVDTALQSPQNAVNAVKNVAGGVANEFNQFAGNPIKNVPLLGIQTPEQNFDQAKETFQHAADHPVNTAIDVANLVGGASAVSPKTDLPPIQQTGGLEKLGNRFLASQFKGAGKVVQNPSETMGNLADYGLTSPDKIANAAAQVTGKDGIVNKMVTNAVKQSGSVNTGGIINNAQALLEDNELISPNSERKILNAVTKSISKATTTGIEGGDPEQMLNTLRTWEGKAQGGGDPFSEAGQIAKVYRGLADDLSQRIFSKADQIVPNGLLSDEDYQTLQGISPTLADQVKNSQSVAELRSLQAPFVQGSKMVRTDERVGNVGMNPSEAIGTASTVVSGNPAGVLVAGMQSRPGMRLVGNTLRNTAAINEKVSPMAAPSATLVSVLPNTVNNAQSDNNQDNNSYNKSHNTGSIPAENGNVKSGIQSQPGRYSFQTPQQEGFLTTQDYTTQQNTLTQTIAQDHATGNTVKEAQDQGQLQQLNNSWNNQKSIRDSGTTLNKFMGVANMAIPIIDKAPTSLFNLNGSYNNLLNSSDPNYRSLGILLQEVEKQSGIKISTATNKESLIKNLDLAMDVMQNDYNSQVQQFFGGNTLNAGAPTQSDLPPITNVQPTQPQVNGVVNVPFNFGSAGQNLPPIQ